MWAEIRSLLQRLRAPAIGLILAAVLWCAQTVTVIGTITRRNNAPAANVLVSIAGQSRYTDVGGRYRIDGVHAGRQTVKVSSEGKVLLEKEVEINKAVSVINLKLP
jgi:hypothetical protein